MLTEEELKKMLQNPLGADWSKLRPEDVGVSMGAAMTEEQMKAYCAQQGIRPNIIKKPPPSVLKKIQKKDTQSGSGQPGSSSHAK